MVSMVSCLQGDWVRLIQPGCWIPGNFKFKEDFSLRQKASVFFLLKEGCSSYFPALTLEEAQLYRSSALVFSPS